VKRPSGSLTSGSTRPMMVNPRRSFWLLAPIHAAAPSSAAKSFHGNPLLGSNDALLRSADQDEVFCSISCLTLRGCEKLVTCPQTSPRLWEEVGIRAQMRGSRVRGRARLPQFVGCLLQTQEVA
jgi:hypothetical protein